MLKNILIFSFLTLLSCSSGQKNKTTETKTNTNTVQMLNYIPYKTIDGTSLTLDIHQPSAKVKNAPLLVWIHGGAWFRGDKKAFIRKNKHLLNTLLNEGYVVASINYRLSGEAVFPAQIQDCNDAIYFLWKNAEKYGINPDKIAVMGRSAGGHLASLVATSNAHHLPDFHQEGTPNSFHIDALVAFFPPTDFLSFANNATTAPENSPEAKFLGGIPTKIPEIAISASPTTYVNADTPPTILLHGLNDTAVPSQQSVLLKSKLDSVQVPNELYLAEGARHGDPVFDTNEYVNNVLTFLKMYFPVN